MRKKPKSKKPLLIGGAISGLLVTLLIIFTSPEYHCYNVAEETKQDYIQFLYDGLNIIDKKKVDSGQARIIDSPDLPINDIRDKAYEFCISQKPDVPATVIIEFETDNEP